MRKAVILGCVLLLVATAGCAGLNKRDKTFVAEGLCLNILTFQLPDDPLTLAESKVPAGARVESVSCTPTDLETIQGVLHRLLGLGYAQIGGTVQ